MIKKCNSKRVWNIFSLNKQVSLQLGNDFNLTTSLNICSKSVKNKLELI